MKTLPSRRFAAVYLFLIIFICIAMVIRTSLLISSIGQIELSLLDTIEIYGVGLLFDVITASYFAIPFVLYQLLLPPKIYGHDWHRYLAYAGYLATIYLLIFTSISEWIFWDEFSSRFNFIAVDYLVYTHEVIGNIRESYPISQILLGILALSIVVFMMVKKQIDIVIAAPCNLQQRFKQSIPFIIIPILGIGLITQSVSQLSENRFVNELANNGIYSFFAAFRNNKLDYDTFYAHEDDQQMAVRLKKLLSENESNFVSNKDNDITHMVTATGEEKHLNVIQITVESLSADFLGTYGDKRNLTPNLDKLAKESLLFNELYATGTRTVRGLEALTLSVPPTPGRSIVKRPDNEGMFSTGFLFRERGYDTHFIYGGYGYFDNMNTFFSQNGFDVIDRTQMDEEKIRFANIWGVSDEDLFDAVLASADKSYQQQKPFYNFVMTTSNHRPYTYPEGRIDIPSHTGRSGGVKYADYAIGYLIEEARKRPWFEDTIFVIVADHCASSAGKEDLTVAKYHIPLMFYSPKHINPGTVDTLMSQIDVPPTLLGLLEFNYESKFFGHDVLNEPNYTQRALLGNYQKLGYLTDHDLTLLATKGEVTAYDVDLKRHQQSPAKVDQEHYLDAVAYYEEASHLYENGRLKYK